MRVLNPSTMPLTGHALIEASAGTGKTYTITGLYLRYLLGMYGATGEGAEPLSIDKILVVTFTDAATQEIKDRVRKRIVDARDALIGAPVKDALINEILSRIENKHAAFDLLDAAAKSMDEAAIFTIHGFCQRMLKQHAFESNLAFNQQFILDQRELIEQAVHDYWRQFVYPLDLEKTKTILDVFANPAQLLKAVAPFINNASVVLEPVVTLSEVLAAKTTYQNDVIDFKEALVEQGFIEAIEASDISGNKAPKHKANLSALKSYITSTDWWFEFGSSHKSFETWSTESVSQPEIYKKNGQPFQHALTAQFDHFAKLHHIVKHQLPIAIMQESLVAIRAKLISQKEKFGILTPDDLLTRLHFALDGKLGETLARNIAVQYPVALIDEFQDTDPIQYGIFNAIYNSSAEVNDLPQLTMIGDPKQAIYGFRGADIFTYIKAKHTVDGERQFTLAKNFRSDKAVVDAVNAVFTQHEDSFIFNRDIPFQKVDAQGKSESDTLTIEGQKPSPLALNVLCDDVDVTAKSSAIPQLAKAFSTEIAALLSKAKHGHARIGDKFVEASDICVLVRDRQEASAMKQALSAVGVSSVFLSRDSVFNQPIARDLYHFVSVLHGKYDEGLIRGVLAGPLFGLTHQELYNLQQDERAWQHYLDRFFLLRKSWDRQGAMAMLELLLVDNALPRLWATRGFNVERILTDYRHLAELLQQKQLELEGTHRVIRWLNQQLADTANEGMQLRLESDADLVKIITMHASKGLEYPIVYLPFATSYRETDEAKFHKDGKTFVDLLKSDAALAAAQKERLAEDIRLLYVALTRAVHHCSIGLFNVGMGRSKKLAITHTALGFVLFGAREFSAAHEWHQALDTISKEQGLTLRMLQGEIDVVTLPAETSSKTPLAVREFGGLVERNWRSTSFSQLTYHTGSDERPTGVIDENHLLDLPAQADDALSSYTFPKGAKAGSCLHEIFELIDFNAPNTPSGEKITLSEAVEKCLAKYAIDEKWQETTSRWILQCLNATLIVDGEQLLSLQKLTMAQCLVEMEFHLPLKPLTALKLNQLLTRITGHSAYLHFDEVQGLLKGFIDLIFEWQGRYFVLDYKSNYLGDSPADYDFENLQTAMNSHQYHLQYIIYTVALHRLLKSRVADYDPDTHLGGSLYLFLRALPDNQGIYFNRLTSSDLAEFDALFVEGEG
ncbi:exodeoxyribonuclease V subunit beta [Pseudoalteromonas xiamenensis]